MGYAAAGVNINDIIAKDVVYKWDAINGDHQVFVGTWADAVNVGHHLGVVLGNNATNAQNDKIGLGTFFIPVDGTYEVRVNGFDDTDKGQMHILLNGADEATVEWYNPASHGRNAQYTETLGVLTKGLYTISLIMSGKAAGSSAYGLNLAALLIIKTA